MIEDQNYLELKSRVLCKNWTNCFRAKRFRLFFSPRYLQPDPPRRWATLSDLWGFKLWLLLHLCQTNFVLIFAVCLSITTPWIQKYEIVRQGISQFCLDICSLHTINQILDPKRDVTILSGYLLFAVCIQLTKFWIQKGMSQLLGLTTSFPELRRLLFSGESKSK